MKSQTLTILPNHTLNIVELQTPPVILSDKNKTYKVKENDEVTFTVKYKGTPKPEAEWSTESKVIKKAPKFIPSIDEESAQLTIKKVIDEDAGDYTIKLTNPVGDAADTLHLIILSKFYHTRQSPHNLTTHYTPTEKPTAPGAPQPVQSADDSLTLYWKAPEDDGNSDITEYILEYKNIKADKWTEIRKIKDTTYTLSKLVIDEEYIFRSIAVNEVGPSPPSPMSPTILMGKPKLEFKPSVQEPLQDTTSELDKTVTLSCIFSGSPAPTVQWTKDKTIIKSETMTYENYVSKYTITTTEETEGTYTCIAENKLGKVETSCKLTIAEKPTIALEDNFLTLRTDSTLTLTSSFSGFPQPEIKWYKETEEITETTERISIQTSKTTSTMVCKKLTRKDSGKYKVVATNKYGSSTAEVTVKVIDKPSRPLSLEVKTIKKDSIKLEWTPPIDDGGLDVLQYTLEKCDLTKNIWVKVSDFEKDINSYCVQKLSENSQYLFRVVASNPIGSSEPTESEAVLIESKFGRLFRSFQVSLWSLVIKIFFKSLLLVH